MSVVKRIGRSVFDRLPPYNSLLYAFCARYADRYNGDNNPQPDKNGELVLLRQLLPGIAGRAVFDVGANVGDWASAVLSINPAVSLHCFEPSRTTFARLAAGTWPAGVRLNNVALGDAPGAMELHVVADESGMNSLYARRGVDAALAVKTETIRVTTIDEYCESNGVAEIGLLKADVEGHELAVLHGARDALARRRIHAIQFEYGGCNLDARVSLGDIWDFLLPLGFALHKVYPEGPRRIAKYQQSLETFKYSNWLAVLEPSRA